MEASLKAKWIEALRSGKYKQAQSVLRHNDGSGYCCLGVLCDISGQGEWDNGDFVTKERDGTLTTSLKRGVSFYHAGMFGLKSSAPRYLMQANDIGISFPAIADWIALLS